MTKRLLNLRSLMLRLKNQQGFTLVELMVVVAIIALLAATALPQFRKYQAKSRVSEAKLALASIYTAEESYYGEYANYATCLAYMGYTPTGAAADRYYDTGFSSQATAHTGVRAGCTTTSPTNFYAGTKHGTTDTVDTADFGDAAMNAAFSVYTAEALGVIDKDNTTSALASDWTITSDKALVEQQSGY